MLVFRPHNKSLHPIWSVGPAFASCSFGAANAGPPAQTGELNRYGHYQLLMKPTCFDRLIFILVFSYAMVGCNKHACDVTVNSKQPSKPESPSSEIKKNAPFANDNITQVLKQYLSSNPSAEQIYEKMASLKLNPPFPWVQNSPYCFTYWKLPDGGGLTIYGWGNTTSLATKAELQDSNKVVLSSVIYLTQDEAKKKLHLMMKSNIEQEKEEIRNERP